MSNKDIGKERKPGYYWVKMSWGEWSIERWNGYRWQDNGHQDGNDYYISFFKEIDETPITREATQVESQEDMWHDIYWLSPEGTMSHEFINAAKELFTITRKP